MNWLGVLQWPGMAATVLASRLVTSRREAFRAYGFRVFLLSNALWIAWGWSAGAWALVALQFCLIALNVRGALKNNAT